MVNWVEAIRTYWVHILMPSAFVFGRFADSAMDQRLTAYRNKSVLFRRELKPGETETWR